MNEEFKTESESRVRVGLRTPPWATQNDKVVDGMVRYIREKGLRWQIDADIKTDNELPPNVINASWSGDGLIVFRCSEREVEAWHKQGIKVVNISSETQIDGVPNIYPDNYQMGALAAEYLMGLGLRNFVFVGEKRRRYSSQRQAGYQDTLEKKGFGCSEIDLEISRMLQTEKWIELHDQINHAIKGLSLPIGVLARDDILAMNVLRSARALGIKVPEEMALIGINDSKPYCLVAFPQLTSVRHPGELVGFHAAGVLHRLLEGEKVTEDVLLKSPGVVERESTNIVAVQDPLVAKALRFIQNHAKTGPVSIGDLCAQLGASHSSLRLRFKKVMGCSAKEEVDRVRCREARLLLLETQLSVQETAFRLGFATPEEFTRFFTRLEGNSPTKFRASRT